jgi:hypothetical protein
MVADRLVADKVIAAPAAAIFAILADPTKHSALDGTGWVVESVENRTLTAVGQIFRMLMYHPNHPDGNYQVVNQVEVFEPPTAICWKPGYDADNGRVEFLRGPRPHRVPALRARASE